MTEIEKKKSRLYSLSFQTQEQCVVSQAAIPLSHYFIYVPLSYPFDVSDIKATCGKENTQTPMKESAVGASERIVYRLEMIALQLLLDLFTIRHRYMSDILRRLSKTYDFPRVFLHSLP